MFLSTEILYEVMYGLQCSQGSELLKGARLYPPDLVMLQASVETNAHTQYIKYTSGSVASDMHAVMSRVGFLTSPAVKSSGKSWADALSGCRTAPCNNTQST